MIKLGFSKDYMPTLEEVTKNKKISFYIIYRYTYIYIDKIQLSGITRNIMTINFNPSQ